MLNKSQCNLNVGRCCKEIFSSSFFKRHTPTTHHTHTLFRTLAPSHLCSWSLILASGFNFKKSWIKDVWGSFLGFPAGSGVKNLSAMQEMQEIPVRSLRQEDPLEEGMAIHFNSLAWRTPWTDEPSGLWSIGSQRVEHDWSIWTHKARTGIISNFTLNMRFVRNESKELGVWEKGGGIQPVMIYWATTRGQTEKAMAPHSSTLAWKIPWTEEPGRPQSMGSLRVRHNWATSLSLFTFMHWRGNGKPLQCSCLENPRDSGAWWASVYGVTQSWTQLKWLSRGQKWNETEISAVWSLPFRVCWGRGGKED